MSLTLKEVLAAAGFKDYFDYTRALRNFSPYRYNKWRIMYGDLINDVFSLDGIKVLDVGCAGGTNVKVFWTHGADSYGCDINERCIRKTPFKSIKNRLSIIETDLIDKFYEHESFDFIHSQQVLTTPVLGRYIHI